MTLNRKLIGQMALDYFKTINGTQSGDGIKAAVEQNGTDVYETAIRMFKESIKDSHTNPLIPDMGEKVAITVDIINQELERSYTVEEAKHFVRQILIEIIDENLGLKSQTTQTA